MTNTSFADSNTESQLSGCEVSMLVNDSISTLQHFRTNGCDKTASIRQILELCISSFGSSHFFHSVTNSVSVNCSTSTNTVNLFMDVSYIFFLGNNESYHSRLFLLHIIDQFHCEVMLQWCCQKFLQLCANSRNLKFV